MKLSGVRPGTRALVPGIGGPGRLGLQYARILGAETIAVDVADERLALVRELGADHAIDARVQDVAEETHRLGGVDATLSPAASNASFSAAYGAPRRDGTLVLVALPAEGKLKLPVFDTVLNGTKIVATREEPPEVFQLHRLGRTRVVRESRGLEDINASIDEVLKGKVSGRLVFGIR
ncbi:zinc-binding dehydrogenase [Streptomyces sp. NPDC048473]|uniref:zinc-binding dehydrogenase n=1 Tax=unclassified Streptomyces TaxID=2593676 RepID=UPI00371AEA59